MTSLRVASLWLLSSSLLSAMEMEELSLDEALDGFELEVEDPIAGSLDPLSVDGALEGFDEEASDAFEVPQLTETQSTSDMIEEESKLAIRGHWLNGLSWNMGHAEPAEGEPDYHGLSRLSSKLWLEAEYPLGDGWHLHGDGYVRRDFSYQLNGAPNYSAAVLDRYQQDWEIGELWVRGSPNESLDLKVGRQIVVWGQSDYLRVNDTVNPIDLREPGLGEIETLRRPLAMLRADYFQGPWRMTGLLIPEQRHNLSPPCGSDFSLAGTLNDADCRAVAVREEFPDNGLTDAEWGVSAMGRFSGWDLSFYRAWLNHDTPYRDGDILRYSRIDQWGAALNVAQGNWLWKGEVAYLDGLDYTAVRNRDRLDLLLGGEYRGFRDVTLTLETVRREIGDYISQLEAAPDYQQQKSWQTVLAYQHDFSNDTVHLKGVVSRSGAGLDEGGYNRLSLEYELDDFWSFLGGGIWYQSAPLPQDWGDNDRLYLEVRRDF